MVIRSSMYTKVIELSREFDDLTTIGRFENEPSPKMADPRKRLPSPTQWVTEGVPQYLNLDGSSNVRSCYRIIQLMAVPIGNIVRPKTIFPTISIFTQDLDLPSHHLVAYLGYRLGLRFGAGSGQSKVYLAGHPELPDLNWAVDKFIREVIRCPECGHPVCRRNPHHDYLSLRCRVCGRKSKTYPPTKFLRRLLIDRKLGADRVKLNRPIDGSGEWDLLHDRTDEDPVETTKDEFPDWDFSPEARRQRRLPFRSSLFQFSDDE